MEVPQPIEHLDRDHEHGLEAELPIANVDKVFQRRAEEVHYHHIVVALPVAIMHVREARHALQVFQKFCFEQELRVSSLSALKFDSEHFPCLCVHGKVNVPEGITTKLAAKAIQAGDFADLRLRM